MDAENITQLTGAITGGVLVAYTAWKARRADNQTRSTGNGFAQDVTSSLEGIARQGRRMQTQMDCQDATLDRLERKISRNTRRLNELDGGE